MEEYRYSKGMVIFCGLICMAFLLIGSGLLIQAFNAVRPDTALIVIAIGLILFGIFCFIEILLTRVIISGQEIQVKSLFGKRVLPLAAVRGFRYERREYTKAIVLIPMDPSFQKLKIPTWLADRDELNAWVISRFDDLDRVAESEERLEILNDPALPFDPVDLESRIDRAKKLVRGLNIGAVAVAFWALFHPRPYELAMIASTLYPLLIILVMRTSGGLIRLNDEKSKALPDIGLAILLPGMAIGLRALLDRDLYDHDPIWPLLIIGVLIMLFLVFFRNREYPANQWKSLGMYLLMGGLLSFHVYGTIVFINCYYDDSEPRLQEAVVVGHHISSGRSKSYHVQVEDIDDVKEFREFTVTSEEYDLIQTGDTVVKISKPGRLGIPWGYIER
jgi:hypothetical protein